MPRKGAPERANLTFYESIIPGTQNFEPFKILNFDLGAWDYVSHISAIVKDCPGKDVNTLVVIEVT